VSARPEETSVIAHRLARTTPGRHGVRWGGVPVDDLPIDEVRARIVVSESDPHLFSGPLREALGGSSDTERYAAIEVASAADALDALEGGMDGELEERGRTLSGGQRQRVALARALLRDPDVLVLVEPTSAVDAHTEARVAERLVGHRAGRTTVLITASPLLLDRADTVLLVEHGRVTAQGRHHDLLRSTPAYRRVVLRGEE
jgi:ABC-type multidrug transport system fused ATPase/permease subunit